jgi:PPOX class probable F420-dependent enzyme
MNTLQPDTLKDLARSQFMNLVTYRKNGVAVTTPVWFAIQDGKIVGTSQPKTGKVKRIRNNPKVLFAPSSMSGKPLGETRPGTARLLALDEYPIADRALQRKYGLQYLLLTGVMKLRGAKEIFWEIIPD